MGVSLEEYRARIGNYNNIKCRTCVSTCITLSYLFLIARNFTLMTLLMAILLLCGDISQNPGPTESFSTNTSTSEANCSFFSNNANSFVSLLHLNIQSLKPKIDIIIGNLCEFDILCFTESWLNPTIPDNDIEIPGFDHPFRKDRTDRPGGGVIVYCKDHIIAKRRPDLEPQGIECLFIEFMLKHEKYLLGTFYRPPNSNQIAWDVIEQSIEQAIDTKIKNIIITGDFNENQLVHGETKIMNISKNYDLYQLITEPTSFAENSMTLIDLLFTNNPQNIQYSGVCEPFLDVNIRYHRPIIALLNVTKPKNSTTRRKIWLYDRGDFKSFRNKIKNAQWENILDTNATMEEITELMTDKILEKASESIPNRVITVRNNDLPWLTNNIKKLMRKRNRLRRKAKNLNSQHFWNKFKIIRNKVVNLLREAKTKYHNDLCHKIKSHKFATKDWWKLVKQISNISNKPRGITGNNTLRKFSVPWL